MDIIQLYSINWILLGTWCFVLLAMGFSAWYTSYTQGPSKFDKVKLGEDLYDVSDFTPIEFEDFLSRWKSDLTRD